MPQLRARAPKVEKSIKTESAIKKPAKKLGPAKKIVQSFEAQDKDVSSKSFLYSNVHYIYRD
jgi:hypothetical protein